MRVTVMDYAHCICACSCTRPSSPFFLSLSPSSFILSSSQTSSALSPRTCPPSTPPNPPRPPRPPRPSPSVSPWGTLAMREGSGALSETTQTISPAPPSTPPPPNLRLKTQKSRTRAEEKEKKRKEKKEAGQMRGQDGLGREGPDCSQPAVRNTITLPASPAFLSALSAGPVSLSTPLRQRGNTQGGLAEWTRESATHRGGGGECYTYNAFD